MTKNASGKLFVSKVTLRSGRSRSPATSIPSAEQLAELHHLVARGMLHRQLGADARSWSRAFVSATSTIGLDACAICRSPTPTAATCWRASASPTSTRCSPTSRGQACSKALVDLPRRQGRDRGRAHPRQAWRRKNVPAGSVPFFVGAGAYKHHVPATRRSSDPALRVPHLLHALSAGDRAGHAAVSVRVPDPGRDAHRHGGRQRLHVRRLDRDRRGRADGASRHQAAQGGARRAACIRTTARSCETLVAHGERRRRRAAADVAAQRGPSRRRSTTACRASSCRRPTSSAICAISRPIAEKAHAAGRAADRGVHRSRLARPACSRRARWAPTSSWARGSRSATR